MKTNFVNDACLFLTTEIDFNDVVARFQNEVKTSSIPSNLDLLYLWYGVYYIVS